VVERACDVDVPRLSFCRTGLLQGKKDNGMIIDANLIKGIEIGFGVGGIVVAIALVLIVAFVRKA
jgi:hypothetical protein